MRTPTVTADWRISLGMALAAIGGTAWWASGFVAETRAVNAQLVAGIQDLRSSFAEMASVQKRQGEDLVEVKTTVKEMRKPVYHTSRVVDAMDDKLAQIMSPAPFVSIYQSPITQN